ncbi:MAG: hypothetical protein GXP15_06095 [Gammaproteobacteria bacterium]|nr:hypothetical protein [Gammaproteobacteria bacterium]
MNLMLKTLSIVSLLTIAPLSFGCDYPARIELPNGLSATKDEMLAGQRSVKKFVADMEVYLECIVAEEKAARSELDSIEAEDEQLREDLLNKKYNAAVDQMERIAAEFNGAVQTYRSRDD